MVLGKGGVFVQMEFEIFRLAISRVFKTCHKEFKRINYDENVVILRINVWIIGSLISYDHFPPITKGKI